MAECRADFETRSDVNLKTVGSAPYFASPHFKTLILCYSIDGGPIERWTYKDAPPQDLFEHIRSGGYIIAFNANFERQCFNWLHANHGWPKPAIDRYRCTAAAAAAMGLPRSLEAVGEALGLKIQKDKRGAALIRKFSIPRRPRKDEDPNGVYFNEPEDFPVEFQEFVDYCAQDVATEAEAASRIVPLSDYEQSVYVLDQIINDRGVRIDKTSAEAAIELVEKAKAKLDAEMRQVTGGAVTACSQVARLTDWIIARGVPAEGLAKADIIELLSLVDLAPDVKRALQIRQEAAKTSTAKLNAFLKRINVDDRILNSFLYHAAGTGRWSNLGANIGNLPRPRFIYADAIEKKRLDVAGVFEAFRSRDPEWLQTLYGSELGRPLHLVSDALRGFIWAAPGHNLMAVDYSGIEGAVIAWLADEEWKLQALREIKADPSLPDVYRRTAAAIVGSTTEIIHAKHPFRSSLGKISELALGFGGGISAFVSMAALYGIDLHALYGPVWESADATDREKAVKRYDRCRRARDKVKTDVLSREAWLACELIKCGWRVANSNIVKLWSAYDDAMRDAITQPGGVFDAGKCRYLVKQGFLWCQLPSGRCLAYGSPKLSGQVWANVMLEDGSWSFEPEIMARDAAEKLERAGRAKIEKAARPAVTALGVNSVTRKYERFNLYPGLSAENNTQSVARDILVNGMFKAESAGYPICMHVYDELVCEMPHGVGSLRELESLACELPAWADGLPLTAHGYRSKRYKKD